nr:PAS domain S-box protein [uncultured Albidiferax sp.]
MSDSRIHTSNAHPRAELDVETTMLYAAYGRQPFNLLLTLASVVLIWWLMWQNFPHPAIAAWLGSLLVCAGLSYLVCLAFQYARPSHKTIARWQTLLTAQGVANGASWSIGPTLLITQAQGTELALLVSIPLVACTVAAVSVAEHRAAMYAFLSTALIPPIMALLLHGDAMERVIAVVMLFGLAAMFVVGHNIYQTMRTSLGSQAQMRAILNASQDAIIGFDSRGRITDWNARAESMFGRSQEEVQGMDFEATLVPERRHKGFRETKAQFLATGDSQHMHQRISTTALHRSGQEFPVEVAIAPLRILKGYQYTAFVTDITARKESEERLALFRRVFDTSSQLVSILDSEGRGLYQNRAHAQELGYSDAEIFGQHFTLTVAPESLDVCATEVRPALAAGGNWNGHLQLQRKDGSRFVASNNIGCIQDANGHIQYIFNIFFDFGPELARRNELAQAKEASERANQAKSDFLSSMSHELRTPMNAILGFSQMLEYDSTLNADQQDNVQEILKGGRHLLTLINEVLDLAQIESGRTNLSLEPVDLAHLVEDCRQLIQPLADARNIRMQLDVQPQVTVRADRVRCKQALLNLLSNAVKYNSEGGEIRLAMLAAQSGRLRMGVTDTGAGIAPERLAELFQPFNRLGAEHGEIEGTGIGLTITRRLVDLMGGEVGVDSQLGVGTTFWIDLPADAPTTDLATTPRSAAASATASAQRYCVLCVDDNPVNLKLIAQTMALRPHIDLLTAHAPELGLELALAHRPDLILLDIHMPGMSGYQLLRVLQADTRLRTTPVIAITANAMPSDIARGRAAGFSDYLTKPLDVSLFLLTVDRCLAGSAKDTP